MGLFKPIWKTDDYSKENKAVNKVSKMKNQKELIQIAKSAPLQKVRGAALNNLTEQADIAEALTCGITLKIRNEYGEWIKNSRHTWHVEDAIQKLADQTLLAEVEKNAMNSDIRQMVKKRLVELKIAAADPSSLTDIAKSESDRYIREAAVNKLTNNAMLIDVAKNSQYDDTRIKAIEKMNDPSVLADIALSHMDISVRLAAVKKITDPSVLVEIAKNGKEENGLRKLAFNMISDSDKRDDILQNCKKGIHVAEFIRETDFAKHYKCLFCGTKGFEGVEQGGIGSFKFKWEESDV